MRNSKYNLVPYEVIERAITGDTAALLAVQERNKAYIGRLKCYTNVVTVVANKI